MSIIQNGADIRLETLLLPSSRTLRLSSDNLITLDLSTTELVLSKSSPAISMNVMLMASTKLLAFPEALKDAEAAIKIDPTFIKAYIRKALVQQGMKDNTAAMETLQKATEADVNKQVSRVFSREEDMTDI
jgi:tetratricopeptide (TPR) repeat protein